MIGDDVRLLARGWESEAASSAAASLTGDDSYRLAGRQRQETARLGLRRHSHCLSLPWFPFSPPHTAGLGVQVQVVKVKLKSDVPIQT